MSEQQLQVGGAAQTLQQRKAQLAGAQQKGPEEQKEVSNNLLDHIILNPQGKLEYKMEYLREQMRNQLGFDDIDQYMDEDDANRLLSLNAIEREDELNNRHEKTQQFKDRMIMMLKYKEQEYKQQILERNAINQRNKGNQRAATQQPNRRQQKEKEDAGDSDDFSSSSGSGSSHSSYSGSSRSGSSSSGSGSSSGSRSSSSGHSRQSRKDNRPDSVNPEQQSLNVKRVDPNDDFSEDEHFEVNTGREKEQEWGVKKQETPKLEIIDQLFELKSIILKRQKLEDWCQELFNMFRDTVKDCFAYVSVQGKYFLTQIVDARENEDHDDIRKCFYELGKKRTNVELLLRQGKNDRWVRMNLISNQDPSDQDFTRMMNAIKRNDNPNALKCLSIEKYNTKKAQLEKIKRQGGFRYTEEQIDEKMEKRFQQKLALGQLNGMNLSMIKVELYHNIEELRKTISNTSISKVKYDLELRLKQLEKQHQQVTEAIAEKQNNDSKHFVEVNDKNGAKIKISVHELEKKLAAEEWTRRQEYYMRHPEQKKNNFFMKKVGAGLLQREDSLAQDGKFDGQLTEEEKQKIALYEEIKQLEKSQGDYEEETRKESCYQKFKRMKREYSDFHKFYFNAPVFDFSVLKSLPVTRPVMAPHPLKRHEEEFQQVGIPEGAKIITFEEYFQNS